LYDGHAIASRALAGERIGIVGVGNMGGRISRRILDAGFAVTGYDRDPAQLERAGVDAAGSAAEVVGAAEVVLLSLPDSNVVEAVVLGPGGILATSRSGQVVVDLSTAAPSSTTQLHAKLAERGVELVDAGISGGAAAAEKGTLTIMAGGSSEALERVRPILETFSARIYHMGESGSGHTAKLLNNFLNGISLTATAETMVAARKAGLDLETFLDVVNNSSGANWATENRFPHIIHGDYLEGGLTGNLLLKDLTLYVDLARALGVPSLHAAGPVAALGLAAGLGYGEQISNRVVDAIGDLAGGVRLQTEGAS
jgi:3-hydroxyisobutyrate dehydrogenase-like beta-hydroxyacid dehydrogenase